MDSAWSSRSVGQDAKAPQATGVRVRSDLTHPLDTSPLPHPAASLCPPGPVPATGQRFAARHADHPSRRDRLVIETGISDALARELPASSFRLDQPLMDRLVGQFPHERARHYLETFFIEARESLTEYGAASDASQPHKPKLEQVMPPPSKK